MQEFEIRLRSVQDVQDFVALATTHSFPVLVSDDHHRVNGKSFMEMFCLNFSQLLIAALDLLRSTDIKDLKGEYTRLFLGPEDYIAAPWESVYTSKERALFQQSTLDVRYWFSVNGYTAGGYPNFPDDHISIMLHFLALMSAKANDALIVGEMDVCRKLLKDQKQFEKEHMLNWLTRYAQDMQGSESNFFYPQLAIAMAEYVMYDQQILDELLEACQDA